MQGKLMNLAVLLDHEPPDVQALCSIASEKVTQERLHNELAQMRQVIRPDLAMRLHVGRSDKSGENVLLEPRLPAALKEVVTKAVRRAANARRRSPGGTQLDVFAYLIRSWLADKGPILVKAIQEAAGASHPTVAAGLEQLKRQGVLHRLSDRSVELNGFPRDEWPRWLLATSQARKIARYVDPSRHARGPHEMAARLPKATKQHVAISGVVGALQHFPDLDITSAPRLDLCIATEPGREDLAFVRKLDASKVAMEAKIVPSGVAEVARLQDSLALAVLGAAGGFLAPILASSGAGSHVALFGYYALLNAGILAIAWFKAWRVLNVLGFAFTFGIATVWGGLNYRPEVYASTQPFLVLFFLMYVAIAVLFARRSAGSVERHLDTTLVFGVPLVAFGLQVGLVQEIAYGSAYSALALGAFYLLLARSMWARRGQDRRLLVEAFLALGTVFATLAIPLAFDGRWTSAAWALEGAAMVWVGVRQQRLPVRLFGILLQLLAGIFFMADLGAPAGDWPVVNSVCLGALLLAVAGLFCAWLLQRPGQALHPAERWLAYLLLGWGVIWWGLGGLHEIDRRVRYLLQGSVALAFFTASCLSFGWLARRLAWPMARYPALALLPLMVLVAMASADHDVHPFAHSGYLVWPLAFAGLLFLLHRHEAPASRYLEWQHAVGLWLFAALGAWEASWAIDSWVAGRAAWPLIAWALFPAALLTLLALRGERLRWPVAAHLASYLVGGATPLAIFLAFWFLLANLVSDGNPWPLPYLPLLNPLDLAQAGAMLAVATWFLEVRRRGLQPLAAAPLSLAWGTAAAAAFVWANAALLRTLHHWAGVPMHLTLMLRSDLVQAALSLFWTLLALGAMVAGTRRASRPLWLLGAGLMAVVVGKLFLVDLSNIGTVERIVSFLGVGVLMLVIGYLAPVPPKQGEGA